MTPDIKELVKRLDENWGRRRIGDMSRLLADAADALEAMAGEVASLQNTFDLMWKADQRAIKLWQEATGKDHIWPDKTKTTLWLLERAEALAAERDRLKAALVEIKTKAPKSSPEMDDDYGGNFDDAWSGGWDSGFNAAANIARKALGGDA